MRPVRKGDLTTVCRMSWKSGSLNLLEPSGPHRACYGSPLPLPFYLLDYQFFHQNKVKSTKLSYSLSFHLVTINRRPIQVLFYPSNAREEFYISCTRCTFLPTEYDTDVDISITVDIKIKNHSNTVSAVATALPTDISCKRLIPIEFRDQIFPEMTSSMWKFCEICLTWSYGGNIKRGWVSVSN